MYKALKVQRLVSTIEVSPGESALEKQLFQDQLQDLPCHLMCVSPHTCSHNKDTRQCQLWCPPQVSLTGPEISFLYVFVASHVFISFVFGFRGAMFRKQPTFRITKSNKVVKDISEHYLRDDITCGCLACEGTGPRGIHNIFPLPALSAFYPFSCS